MALLLMGLSDGHFSANAFAVSAGCLAFAGAATYALSRRARRVAAVRTPRGTSRAGVVGAVLGMVIFAVFGVGPVVGGLFGGVLFGMLLGLTRVEPVNPTE